jgi:hypothetical protein
VDAGWPRNSVDNAAAAGFAIIKAVAGCPTTVRPWGEAMSKRVTDSLESGGLGGLWTIHGKEFGLLCVSMDV